MSWALPRSSTTWWTNRMRISVPPSALDEADEFGDPGRVRVPLGQVPADLGDHHGVVVGSLEDVGDALRGVLAEHELGARLPVDPRHVLGRLVEERDGARRRGLEGAAGDQAQVIEG